MPASSRVFLVGACPRTSACRRAWRDAVLRDRGRQSTTRPFCDKRSKFVHYRPRTAILNNLEFDHADIFADLAAIETQFHHLVRIVPKTGRIVANAPRRPTAAGDCPRLLVGAGVVQRRGRLVGGRRGERQDEVVLRFEAARSAAAACPVGPPQPGQRAGGHRGGAPCRGDAEVALDALTRFEGVKRRLELRGTVRGVAVYDDFAHHPTAITLTVEGLRRQVGEARILAVLEPRSNTMKLGVMKDQLADSLAQADKVFCYAANLGWDARGAGTDRRQDAGEDDLDALVAAIVAEARDGDRIW